MIGCFTAGVCYNLGKTKEIRVMLLQSVSFVATNTKKTLKCSYYLW